uniref:LD10926p n=1 Tax=Drosophila melanogaster TaxID=7227 RepID=Q95RS0_DROME|nr:LD14688p [Drosophila melanogaster]AAS93760.1 LD10926p [Drosophila melanogaster]
MLNLSKTKSVFFMSPNCTCPHLCRRVCPCPCPCSFFFVMFLSFVICPLSFGR